LGFRENLTSFLQEYLLFAKHSYEEDGTLTDLATQQAAKVLLDCGVFDSPQEMRKQAYKDYGILLPESMFTGEKE
jgi:hypothetical protein